MAELPKTTLKAGSSRRKGCLQSSENRLQPRRQSLTPSIRRDGRIKYCQTRKVFICLTSHSPFVLEVPGECVSQKVEREERGRPEIQKTGDYTSKRDRAHCTCRAVAQGHHSHSEAGGCGSQSRLDQGDKRLQSLDETDRPLLWPELCPTPLPSSSDEILTPKVTVVWSPHKWD